MKVTEQSLHQLPPSDNHRVIPEKLRNGRARHDADGTACAKRDSAMPISIAHEGDNLFRLDIRGTLRLVEFETCQERLIAEMARTGPSRLLFVLKEFKGWEPDAGWSDLSFYVKHGDKIERIAIVGPERWRSEALMFAAADLRKAPVEFFAEGNVAEARAWLTS